VTSDPRHQHRGRSLKDISAETGVQVEDLSALARTAGIPVRHGKQFARDLCQALEC
jgi:DNA-binding Xre family transcriptional regulator